MTDYTTVRDVAAACGSDALKWAIAYHQHAEKFGPFGVDATLGWFANAMMRALDEKRWADERATRHPPGSQMTATTTEEAVADPADVTIASQDGAWWFYETEYREDMVIGPFDSEAGCRLAVDHFYGHGNPFGSGKTEYVITGVRHCLASTHPTRRETP